MDHGMDHGIDNGTDHGNHIFQSLPEDIETGSASIPQINVALGERMIPVHDEPILLTDINLEEHRVTFDKDIQSGTINELQTNLNNSFFNKKKYFLVCLIISSYCFLYLVIVFLRNIL
jgi:hypothetical protein